MQPASISSEPKATSSPYCSCVRYIKQIYADLPNLDAIDFPLNTIGPKAGDIIKLQYYNATTTKYTYHIAFIEEITEEGYKIKEGNFEKCKETKRFIAKDDDHILGFFNMDRQRLIDALTPIQKQTLWNESGWSMYDTKGGYLTGKAGEVGVGQWLKTSWNDMENLRRKRKEKEILLNIYEFEAQIKQFRYGWENGVVWYGKPK